MIDPSAISVRASHTLREAMRIIDQGAIGIALLIDEAGALSRTVTDGDLRRQLLEGCTLDDLVESLDPKTPLTLPEAASLRECLNLMTTEGVDCIPLVDPKGAPTRIVVRSELDSRILLSTPHMGEDELSFVKQAFDTNWIAPLGPNVDEFERELAAKVGIGHAAATSSGTAGIHLALKLLDVGPGDRVFCSTLTFAASANPIVYLGAEPVFIDCDETSWNLCPIALQRAFEASARAGKLPKAVIVVSLYGQSADMDPILEICERYRVAVIEDAAESLGATYKGKASGTLGRLGIYSFNGNKIITTSGGGMIISDDKELIDRAKFLATQAREPEQHYEHREIGYNYRMSNILAGVGRGQLRVLDERVRQRRAIFERYRNELEDLPEIDWMPEPEWSVGTRWLTACTLATGHEGRRRLIEGLADEMIEARPVWKPMHLQPVFAGTEIFCAGNERISDRLFNAGVCLPSGSSLTEMDIQRTIHSIRKILR